MAQRFGSAGVGAVEGLEGLIRRQLEEEAIRASMERQRALTDQGNRMLNQQADRDVQRSREFGATHGLAERQLGQQAGQFQQSLGLDQQRVSQAGELGREQNRIMGGNLDVRSRLADADIANQRILTGLQQRASGREDELLPGLIDLNAARAVRERGMGAFDQARADQFTQQGSGIVPTEVDPAAATLLRESSFNQFAPRIIPRGEKDTGVPFFPFDNQGPTSDADLEQLASMGNAVAREELMRRHIEDNDLIKADGTEFTEADIRQMLVNGDFERTFPHLQPPRRVR